MQEIIYDDNTQCPIGVHKTKPMKDIPPSWFIWLCKETNNGKFLLNIPLKKYIEKNIKRFELEVVAEKQKRKFERQ